MSEKTQFPGDTHRESAQYGLQIWLHIFRKGTVATARLKTMEMCKKILALSGLEQNWGETNSGNVRYPLMALDTDREQSNIGV